MNRKKVFLIDEWLPLPLESGKKIRTFNLLKKCADEYEITVFCYCNPEKEKEPLKILNQIGIKSICVPDNRIKKWGLKFYFTILLNLLQKEPYSSIYHLKKEFIYCLKEAINKEKPDLIQCEWTNYSPLIEHLPKCIPIIISSHNIESDIWWRFYKSERNFIKKIIAKNQAEKIEKLERKWYPIADRCIAVSEKDKYDIESYGGKVSVVENGVDLEYYNCYKGEIEENSIGFTASFNTFSNQDGAKYLVEEVFPKIIAQKDNVKLYLIGKDPPKWIADYGLKNKNIIVTGTVNDIRIYLSKIEISIVPLRIGGGSRLKILEAMAFKKPVVSTSIGAEGLRIENGKNIILNDSSDGLAESIIKCLNNKELGEKISINAYRLVKEKYGWNTLAKKQKMIWNSTINS